MKRIYAFVLILVALLLVGCATTPGTEVFRFEMREVNLVVGEEKELDLILGTHKEETIEFEILDNGTAVQIVEAFNDSVKVKAVEVGEVSFKAYVKEATNVSDVIIITVTEPAYNYIEVLPATDQTPVVYIGETYQLSANGSPAFENKQPVWVYESLNEKIATVDQNGLVTGKSMSLVNIKVYEEGDPTLYAVKSLIIEYVPIASIKVNSQTVNLKVGETFRIEAVAYDKDGNSNTVSQTFSFTSKRIVVASVTKDGVITAVSEGTATITVNSRVNITVNVTYKEEIDKDSITITKGTNIALDKILGVKGLTGALVEGEQEGVLSFPSSSKNIKAEEVGTVKVLVSQGEKQKEITVNVIDIVLENETLNNAEVTLTMTDFSEDNYEIASNVTVTDANGNADYEVSSSNEAVLTVTKNENGIVVKLVGVGNATLKISYNDCSKDIVVIIK